MFRPTDFDPIISRLMRDGADYAQAVNAFRRQFVIATLKASGGNQCHAAQKMGMHRNTLGRLLDVLNIRPSDYRLQRGKHLGWNVTSRCA